MPESSAQTRRETVKGSEATGETDSLRAELTNLRAQLASLKASQTVATEKDASEPADVSSVSGASGTGGGSKPETKTAAETAPADLSTQIQELLDEMNRDVKQVNPITLMAVFALGTLVGRLLPR